MMELKDFFKYVILSLRIHTCVGVVPKMHMHKKTFKVLADIPTVIVLYQQYYMHAQTVREYSLTCMHVCTYIHYPYMYYCTLHILRNLYGKNCWLSHDLKHFEKLEVYS